MILAMNLAMDRASVLHTAINYNYSNYNMIVAPSHRPPFLAQQETGTSRQGSERPGLRLPP